MNTLFVSTVTGRLPVFNTPMSIYARLTAEGERSHEMKIQFRRFSKLRGIALDIATDVLYRHISANDRMDVDLTPGGVREIIDDALRGQDITQMRD